MKIVEGQRIRFTTTALKELVECGGGQVGDGVVIVRAQVESLDESRPLGWIDLPRGHYRVEKIAGDIVTAIYEGAP